MQTDSTCSSRVDAHLKNVPKAQPYSAAIDGVRFSPTMPLSPLMLIINCSAMQKAPFAVRGG